MELNYLKPFESIKGGVDEKNYQEIMNNHENALQELLETLDYTVENAEKICRDNTYLMHIPTLMILAFWREKQSYPLIIKMAKLPSDIINPLLEDVITENLTSIFASVYDGTSELMFEVIADQNVDSFVKIAAIDAIIVLLVEGIMTRDEVVVLFKRLFNEKINDLDDMVLEHLIDTSLEIHPDGLYEEIKNATDGDALGWSSPEVDEWLQDLKNKPISEVLDALKEATWYRMVSEEDVLELSNWLGETNGSLEKNGLDSEFYKYLENEEFNFSPKDYAYDEWENSETVINEIKVGRNEPCTCGSGKKYKKCCLV